MIEVGMDNPQTALNPSAEEQVFSNPLLMDIIWKHLDSQDLIRTSLVNLAWHNKSREVLIKFNEIHPVLIQIYDDSPCRALVRFNEFLEENYRSESPVIFNGIQLKTNDHYKLTNQSQFRCRNCFEQSPFYKTLEDWNEEPARKENDKIKFVEEMFANILDRMKFLYIRIDGRLSWSLCPFPVFLLAVVKQNAATALELDFGSGGQNSLVFEIFRRYTFGGRPSLKFPRVKTIGMELGEFSPLQFVGSREILPAINRLNRATLYPISRNWEEMNNFPVPLQAIKALGTKDYEEERITSCIDFLNEVQPQIEHLILEWDPSKLKRKQEIDSDHQHQHRLFQMGGLVSKSLKNLSCSPITFTFLASSFDPDSRTLVMNHFRVLESLELTGDADVDLMNWFVWSDFGEFSPKLKQIQINFKDLAIDPEVIMHGPQNRFPYSGNRMISSATVLIMKASNVNIVFMEPVCRWLNLFENIRHLNLIGMPFKCDSNDQAFAKICGEIQHFPTLEEISISSANLASFTLDHLFLENIQEIEEFLEERKATHLLIYKSSLLNHKNMRKINIHGTEICTERRTKDGKRECFSSQIWGTFLVSSETARLIQKHVPGFKFCLKIRADVITECNNIHCPGGFRFEHLKAHSRISFHESISKGRLWEIEFFN